MLNRYRLKIVDKAFRAKRYCIYDKVLNKLYVENIERGPDIYTNRARAYAKRDELNSKSNTALINKR